MVLILSKGYACESSTVEGRGPVVFWSSLCKSEYGTQCAQLQSAQRFREHKSREIKVDEMKTTRNADLFFQVLRTKMYIQQHDNQIFLANSESWDFFKLSITFRYV